MTFQYFTNNQKEMYEFSRQFDISTVVGLPLGSQVIFVKGLFKSQRGHGQQV